MESRWAIVLVIPYSVSKSRVAGFLACPGAGGNRIGPAVRGDNEYAENSQVSVWRLQCHCLCCADDGQRVPLSRLPASVRRAMEQRRVLSEGNCPPGRNNKIYTRTSNAGTRINHHFCPTCGVTVCWTRETGSTRFGIPVWAFNDPSFPPHRYQFGKKDDTSGRLPWKMWIIGTGNHLLSEAHSGALAHQPRLAS
jgi:hypothetical protein